MKRACRRFYSRKRLARLVVTGLTSILLSTFFWSLVYAAVTLVYFRADATDNSVLLEWETATEIDNAGFYVNRSLAESGPYQRISPFIFSQGDDLIGAVYQYEDTDVVTGTAYWYKLESIDLNQNAEFYEPPVMAVPGGTPTPSPSPTASQTASLTPSATNSATVTLTPTVTPSQTPDAYPGPATATATQVPAKTPTRTQAAYPAPATATRTPLVTLQATATNASTLTPEVKENPQPGYPEPLIVAGEGGATATLLPLPEVAMEFPTASSTIALEQEPPQPAGRRWLTGARLGFLAFIALLWAGLGAWFYISYRRIS